MQIITADLTMCADCALTIANGVDPHDDAARAHLLVMWEHTKTWTGTIVVDSLDTDFSTRHCDTCGSTLAGARFSGALLESLPGEPRVALIERGA